MLHWKISPKRFRGWILWTLSLGISWAIIAFPGLKIRDVQISTWNAIPSLALNILLASAVLGAVIGLIQFLALRFDLWVSPWWILISTASYAIGIPLGFITATTGIGAINPQALANTGSDFLMMPLGMTMLLGGAFAGLIQAYTLRKDFLKAAWRHLLLWTLGTALGWGLGFFVSNLCWGWGMSLVLQSVAAGVVIGAITGIWLMVSVKSEA